jgi:uncharacterized protein (DUF1499 family)
MKLPHLLAILTMCSSTVFSSESLLKPCPDTPNCVSSLANDEHAIQPFQLKPGTLDLEKLISLIQTSDRHVTVTQQGNQIHAEFTSRIFRFVDDLDLIINLKQNNVHIRSASRTGHYDFGVNRRRVENIRTILKNEGIIQ